MVRWAGGGGVLNDTMIIAVDNFLENILFLIFFIWTYFKLKYRSYSEIVHTTRSNDNRMS